MKYQKSFGNLANYKKMHMKRAANENKVAALEACTTLTQAKKLMFGEKTKKCSGWKGHEGWITSNMPGGRNK